MHERSNETNSDQTHTETSRSVQINARMEHLALA